MQQNYNTKMNTIFMNSKNSKTSHSHRLLLNLTYKIDLRRKDIYCFIKPQYLLYMNNKFKISAPTLNEEFELPDASYSIPDIQDYFEYILKTHGEKTVNPSKKTYKNEIENRITFKIKKLKQDIILKF